jgi:hypothetical protein
MDVKIAGLLAFFFLPLPQPETRPARAVIVPTAGSDKLAAKQYPLSSRRFNNLVSLNHSYKTASTTQIAFAWENENHRLGGDGDERSGPA